MASHVAASAFGHCLAMVRDEEVAAHLAAVAVRRGGRSLGNVLGHARHQALAWAQDTPLPPVELGADAGATDVAWALAASRPPVELAIIDLSGRYGLGRAGLGTALGLSPAVAAARVATVGQSWDAELDPALLAWLGPGDCDGLAAVLDGAVRTSAPELLRLAGDVAAHSAACDACGDRRRAAASVRLLVAGTPLPVPPLPVVAAAGRGRLQPPHLPPPLEPRRRRVGVWAVAGVAAVAVVVGGAAAVTRAGSDDDPGSASTRALAMLPDARSSLELLPSELELSAGEVSLLNTSEADVAWEADADASWLEVVPARGRLEAGREQVLRLDGSPPEGEVRTRVRVSGEDGSAAAATLVGTVEHPPDLGATAVRCRVTAMVEDETEVSLVLHARDGTGTETQRPMVVTDAGARADLPAGRAPLTWWVSAVDGRGNQARTADVVVPSGC